MIQYFGAVSDLLPPLVKEDMPRNCHSDLLPALEDWQVKMMIKKKPSSMVDGDVFPFLYNMFDFSTAVTPVYNMVLSTGIWPSKWKVETITVIPKVPNPSDLSQCRNSSCTNFLSKVLETLVLDRLREEIGEDKIQYGGVKGSGVEHLLVEVWERILGGLEIPDIARLCLGSTTKRSLIGWVITSV